MSAVRSMVDADLRGMWRDGRLAIMFALCLAVGAVSAWCGAERVTLHERDRIRAQAEDLRSFRNQPPTNAHSAAHFGQIAFKPLPRLAALDPGLSGYLGSTIWMEAHWQDPANNRGAEDSQAAQQLVDLSPSWALRVLAPLVIIVLGFPLIAADREGGMIRQIALSGMTPGHLFASKVSALGAGSALALSPLVAAAALAPALAHGSAASDSLVRGLILLATFGLYLGLFVVLTLAGAAIARSVRQSLSISVAIWVAAVIITPRVADAVTDLLAPGPTAQAFWSTVQADVDQGMDGHDPSDARAEALKAEVLARYGVERTEDLPIGFAGVALQASESYGDKVFDRRYGDLYSAYERQSDLARAVALFTPAAIMRDASATASGVDSSHHRDFAEAAERHRREIVRRLNEDVTEHGAGYGREGLDRLSGPDLWRTIPAFRYTPPPLSSEALRRLALDLAVLLGWTLGAATLAYGATRRAWQA